MTIENIIASYSDTQKKILEYAIEAHGNQKRKYTGEPYWHHLVNVSGMLEDDGISKEAALLHDILEDTEVKRYDLIQFLQPLTIHPHGIISVVLTMTEEKKYRRIKSKFAYVNQFPETGISCELKIADLIDNAKSIKEHDPKFWNQFRMEAYVYLYKFREMDRNKPYIKLKNILEK